MRSPTFLIVSLLSTNLLNGTSASASFAASSSSATGIPQVSHILASSIKMLENVNKTLRLIQGGVSASDESKVSQSLSEQARNFAFLTEQLKAASANSADTAQPNVQVHTPTPISTPMPIPNPTQSQITSPIQTQSQITSQILTQTPHTQVEFEFVTEISPSESSSHISSSNQSLNVRLASTTSPTNYPDQATDIENEISRVNKRKFDKGPEEDLDNKTVRKETISDVPVATIKARLAARKLAGQSNSIASSGSAIQSPVGPVVHKLVGSSFPKEVSVPASTFQEVPPATQMKSATSSVSPLQNANTTPVSSISSLQNANTTPASSGVEELIGLLENTAVFLERFLDLESSLTVQNGQTLFEIAVRSNNSDIAELLLGADFLCTTFATGENVLAWVIQNKNSKMARSLMSHQAFRDQVTYFILGASKYDRDLAAFLKKFIKNN